MKSVRALQTSWLGRPMSLAPDSVSLLFRTPASAWRDVKAALDPRSRSTELEVVVAARTGLRHADIDAALEQRQRAIAWDFLIHAVEFDRRNATRVSKALGYLEGFGRWLVRIYGEDFAIEQVHCSAYFELSTKRYANELGLPRDWVLPPDRSKSARVYSLGAEEADGRWIVEVEPSGDSLTVGVGCLIENVPANRFIESATEVAIQRASRLIHEVRK